MSQIIVLNFGSQVAHLINRRVRELGIYSELAPHDITATEVRKINPRGIIFSGGPASVYESDAPHPNPELYDLGIPILGICYGMQLMGEKYGKVAAGQQKEYGKNTLLMQSQGILLKKLPKKSTIWMSHGDLLKQLPKEFKILGKTKTCPIASFENYPKKIYGVQFHPEVAHTEYGMQILRNFVLDICTAQKDWNLRNQKLKLIKEIKKTVGNYAVIMGLSGGIDSTVAASLIHEAIGSNLHCVFIDHGLIRKNEAEEVERNFKKHLGFKNFYMIDASRLFLTRLKNASDPEQKRKIIGHAFIDVFEQKEKELKHKHPNIRFLGQGTIYPDRVESATTSKAASKIKSHHNLTLPERMHLIVIEPLKELYKDEVRMLAKELKLPDEMIFRHPFPGPGFAIRIVGKITPERLRILREADHIFMEELRKSGQYKKVWQALAALFPIKTVGVKGDARTYEYVISLRAVTSLDAMTADWAKLPNSLLETVSTRILNEVNGVNRVVYDITQKPPGTIEYE